MVRVCVIGLGTVGHPTAKRIKRYHEVYGYDVDPSKVRNRGYFATTQWEHIYDIDVFVICVNTWWKEKPDMSAVRKVMEMIKEKSTPNTLVTIESTLSIGACREFFKEIFDGQIMLSCCPHRYWEKDSKNYGVAQLRVLGGVDDDSLEVSTSFYRSIKVPIYVVPYVEIAEMSKLVENAYRFVEIAFVEELKGICEENNIDLEEIRMACNTKWNVDLLEARDGIVGSCLPKDIRILNHLASFAPLLQGAIKADIQYKGRLLRR